MKKILFWLFLFFKLICISQAKNNSLYKANLPIEKITLYHTSNVYLVGHRLQYKIHCTNIRNKTSNISKIVYVELISSNKKPIFKQKLKLEKGYAQGDFLIPSSLSSNNYKLIAYTNLIRNLGEESFFEEDIFIINPYNNLKKTNIDHTLKCSLNLNSQNNNEIKNKFINLKTNKKNFKKREKVDLEILGLKNKSSNGSYTVSVRKVSPFSLKNTSVYKNAQNLSIDTLKYLPEIRGEIISGNITHTIINQSSSIKDISIGLSIPGKKGFFKISKTNNNGKFYFNLDQNYESDYLVAQVIDENKENYVLQLDTQEKKINYNKFNFCEINISPKLNKEILNYSIYNQIENAYKSIKPDSIKRTDGISSFFDSKANHYILDDYTRFPTLKETLVEVVNGLYISKNENGDEVFKVRGYFSKQEKNIKPLILMDGVFISNHESIINFDPNKIKSISVLTEKFIYDNHVFNGIASIKTENEDYIPNIEGKKFLKMINISQPAKRKIYYEVDYKSQDKLKRIPDYRIQLLWNPNITINNNNLSLSFYTSDIEGDFEILLKGITENGDEVFVSKIISVVK